LASSDQLITQLTESSTDTWAHTQKQNRLKRAGEGAAEAKQALAEHAEGGSIVNCHVCLVGGREGWGGVCPFLRVHVCGRWVIVSIPRTHVWATNTHTALGKAEAAAAEVEELRTRLAEAEGERDRKGKEVERLKQVCGCLWMRVWIPKPSPEPSSLKRTNLYQTIQPINQHKPNSGCRSRTRAPPRW
jgi:hypothetical protein